MDLDPRVAEFIHASWEMPGKPMISTVIITASMLNEEGEEVWAYYPMGDGGTTTYVGLLELTKAQIIDNTLYECEDEEDY